MWNLHLVMLIILALNSFFFTANNIQFTHHVRDCIPAFSLNSVVFSPDGHFLVGVGQSGKVIVWDIQSGKRLVELQPLVNVQSLNKVVFSPDGRYIVASTDQEAILWDFLSRKQINIFIVKPQDAAPEGLSIYFTSDSKQILIADASGGVLWNVQSGEKVKEFRHSPSEEGFRAKLSPDGKYILTNGLEDGIWLWNTQTGKVIEKFLADNDANAMYTYGSLTPDGKHIIMTKGDKTLFIWDISTKRKLWQIDLTAKSVGWYFSPDGKYLLLTPNTNPPTAELWNLDTDKKLFTIQFEGSNIFFAVFSPDSKYMIIPDSETIGAGTSSFNLWSLEDQRISNKLTMKEHPIQSIEFSPDSKWMAIIYTDGPLQIWNMREFSLLEALC